MTFVLGAKSLKNLQGVHPDLVKVVKLAITLTEVDFAVHEGLRSLETQREYVRRGVSKTMESRHLTGHAVDLVPYVGGQLRWEWVPIYSIAHAMDEAADRLDVVLRWGGVWDRTLNQYGGSIVALERAVKEYTVRHPGPDFIDGPHFEIPKGKCE